MKKAKKPTFDQRIKNLGKETEPTLDERINGVITDKEVADLNACSQTLQKLSNGECFAGALTIADLWFAFGLEGIMKDALSELSREIDNCFPEGRPDAWKEGKAA